MYDLPLVNRILSALGHLIFCSNESVGLLSALEFPAANMFVSYPIAVQRLAEDIRAMIASQ